MRQLNFQALVNGPRLIFCLALLLALGLRFYKLGEVPPALSTDEAIYGVAALKYQTSFLNININQGDPWGALWHTPEYTRPIIAGMYDLQTMEHLKVFPSDSDYMTLTKVRLDK